MKNFRDYLLESEQAADNPVAGDTFAINIREECLIESVVVESRDDGVVIAADDRMMQLLESYGYTFEENCMECGMMECGCGSSEQYSDDESPDAGEYDQEGSMAKDDLNTIVGAARKLMGLLGNNDNMPEWTQSKIDRAADYVDTAADYIGSQKERGVMEQDVAENSDAASIRERIASLQRDLKAVTGNYPGDDRNRTILRRQIFDLKAQLKAAGAKKSDVSEGSGEPNPVARAILHRIMMQHTGLLATHGPERVMSAVDEVADYIGDVEEIGTSDVSGWVRHVEQMLSNMPDELDEQGVAEGPVGGEINDTWMNDKHKEFYKRNPHFKRNNRDRVEVGHGTQLATRVDPAVKPAQVQKKPATPFGITEAATMASVSKLLRHIERHHPTWFDDYGLGEVEDTVVDMAEQGTFSGMTVVDAAALVGQELESMYGADAMSEAEYQGRKVPLGKPMRGDVKKSKVYVKNPQGNVVKVNFGDPDMKIKKSNPDRRKNFRARHNCDNPGPRHKARYWSCRAW